MSMIVNILRFLVTIFGTAMNMNRILKSDKNMMDDILFVLSIFIGLIFGLYWNNFIKLFEVK